ncbi:MAG: DNA repair protein RadA [Geminicoccaceae bacterium]|nr:DNA repair protein RadA [Geminicoccaceae bacterium]MCX8102145.1 DNA repair protein RadA [Geminicoccaceae bacterium]
MSRAKSSFLCQACGAVHARWAGRCEACGAWNTIAEEPATATGPGPSPVAGKRGKGIELLPLAGPETPPPRLSTGIEELDRVLGGGLVPGSAILLGGDPGIGKSTLTLQAAAALARAGEKVVYLSGEESVEQIRLRARRLGLADAPLALAAATRVEDVVATLDRPGGPALLVADSVQTLWTEALEAAPGTVSQLRAAAQALVGLAKRRGTAVLLIGHVTKEGAIAGPKVLEHMVDTVLYFEGERGEAFRILRAVKNRFGPANEIGVFEMTEAGLSPVADASALFLAQREEGVAGSVVFAGMEGSRPLLVEIQALVGAAAYGTARRAVVGWDPGRLAMVLAVLEARCGLVTGGRDVYLNVAGGLRIAEPAADLAVAAAIVSAMLGAPLPSATVVFGEVGLAGEVRAVGHAQARLKEAVKLGFKRAVVPEASAVDAPGLELLGLRRLVELVERLDRARERITS